MKNLLIYSILLLLANGCGEEKLAATRPNIETAVLKHKQTTIGFQEGDIIFQTSQSEQSKAIQLATHSNYSHVGIIFKSNNTLLVYEAVQPVKFTPIEQWIKRGDGGHYVVKRLKNAENLLHKEVIEKMKKISNNYLGKNYDIHFEWSDDKIYCSELVWKIYKQSTGIEIGKLTELRSFDLSHPIVKQKMKERYGTNIPLHEKVISPAAMFNSVKLITVKEE